MLENENSIETITVEDSDDGGEINENPESEGDDDGN